MMGLILKHKKWFAFIFWLYVTVIIFFTLTPQTPKMNVELNGEIFRLDYVLHFIVYFCLSVLYIFWRADNYLKVKLKYMAYFLIFAFILSGLIEYIQLYIPGRTFNPIDYYANSAGIILGSIFPKLIPGKPIKY